MKNKILEKIEEIEKMKNNLKEKCLILDLDIVKQDDHIAIKSIKLIDENDSFPGIAIRLDFGQNAVFGTYWFDGLDKDFMERRLTDAETIINTLNEVAKNYKKSFEIDESNGTFRVI